jgi:hypothetical protein
MSEWSSDYRITRELLDADFEILENISGTGTFGYRQRHVKVRMLEPSNRRF